MATLKELQDLPLGATVVVRRKDSFWNNLGKMDYLMGKTLVKSVVAGEYAFTITHGKLRVKKSYADETWLLLPDGVDVECSVLSSPGIAEVSNKVQSVVTPVIAANKSAAVIASRVEAGRLALKSLAAAISAIPGLPEGAPALLSSSLGKLLLANKLQLLASSGMLPQGKTQEALDFVASGALTSVYLDIIHSWDIDRVLSDLTAGLLPSGEKQLTTKKG